MIDIKQAVKAAANFVKSLYEPDELVDLTLEEVELSDNETNWLVTFGFTRHLTEPVIEGSVRSASTSRPFDWLSNSRYAIREYKIIQVDASTGDAKSMKIRAI